MAIYIVTFQIKYPTSMQIKVAVLMGEINKSMLDQSEAPRFCKSATYHTQIHITPIVSLLHNSMY
jgi:hypothetical protein